MASSGYFITGTDTGIGKTVATAALQAVLQSEGRSTGIMKPIETGVDAHCSSSANSDAKFLLEAAGLTDELSDICPVRLKTPAAPYQAALMEGVDIDVSLILAAYQRLAEKYEVMLVEGVGGLLVPISKNYAVIDLISDMGLPVLIVAGYQLGTLNHTLMTLRNLKEKNLTVTGILMTQFDPEPLTEVEQQQPELISELSGVPILGELPYIDNLSTNSFTGEFLNHLRQNIHPSLLTPNG